MSNRTFSLVRGICAAALLVLIPAAHLASAASAQGSGNRATGKSASSSKANRGEVNEYLQARRKLKGAAGNPECVWLGSRIVSLLWRDDLDTAFSHLDLYDRFHCPQSHVQAAFRCLIAHADRVDAKVPDSLNKEVEACWLDPTRQASPAAAVASNGASKR